MDKPSLDNKVFTDNPLLDEIIYNIRQLATGTVLKDKDKADNAETLESMQSGDLLVAISQGMVRFEYFHYDEDFLRKVPGISDENIVKYAADNNLIPQDLRPVVLSMATQQFIDNYIETNNYYRMLHGDPNYDPTGVWEGLWIDVNTIEEGVASNAISPYYIDTPGTDYRPFSELETAYVETLYDNGTIDNIINNTDQLTAWNLTKDDVLYLNHLGARSIDYYDARVADRFELLYCPESDAEEVRSRYKSLLEANRLYTTYTVYSEAYKFQSDYYDNFMMILIIIQTMIDMIVELPEYIIRRDVFDARTCQYIFESNGVRYFPDIPLRYQISLVKNLNKLIKFKSTDKCIVDIISIFGVDSIQVFKYYILRSRDVVETDVVQYEDKTKVIEDEEGKEIVPDNDENYTLKFVKVPILGKVDDYIRTPNNIYEYDSIIDGDAYWIGDKDYNTVESSIKDLDFTLLRSKYYSVEAVIDLTERNFTLVYFMNILLYNHIDKSQLQVSLPNISTKKKFELVDVIIALYSLSYIYYGVEDTIMDSQQKIAQILGFNMEADLQAIADYLYENHGRLSLKDLHVDGFQIPPDDQIISFNQLQEIYMTNKEIFQHVREMMIDPPNKRIYDAYKYIYQSLFIMRCNMDYYKLPNGQMATTYREFLRYKDPVLYSFLQDDIASIRNAEARQTACVNAIQAITTYLEDYIDQDLVDLDDVFAGLPSISLDFIKDYVEEVIDFFKSFKIFTHSSSILYLFNDKFENTVLIIDDLRLWYLLDKAEYVKIEEWIKNLHLEMSKEERYELMDKVYLSIDTWVQKNWSTYYNSDKYEDLTNIIRDWKEHYSKFEFHDTSIEEILALDAIIEILVDLHYMDTMIYKEDNDHIHTTDTYDLATYYDEWLQDVVALFIVYLNPDDRYKIIDDITRSSTIDGYSLLKSFEKIGKENVNMVLDDKNLEEFGYRPQDDYYLIITNSRD